MRSARAGACPAAGLKEAEELHQALYRKWRPQRFADVCGQDHVTSILRYEVAEGKTSHAYLFCGTRGTGKTTCAKILARAVNCEHPTDGDPCGECDSCKSSASGGCIDIVEMDAASNNGVDDIRKIREDVEYLPVELKYKVYIIDEVHMLSASAFNALLKTLEEPPPHVIFILATTELQKIPATILSRCQRFDFRRISSDVIASRLEYIAVKENLTLEHDAAFMLAHLAQGGMRDAISLLELCSGEGRPITCETVEEIAGTGGRDSVVRLVHAVADKNYDAVFAEVGNIFMSSRDLAVWWQDIIAFYRDMLVCKVSRGAREYLDLSDKQYAETVEAAGRFSVETLIYHSGILDESLDEIRRAVSSKRLIAEMTLVRMCDERFSATNESLASRIAALEDRLNSGAFTARPPQRTAEVQTSADASSPVEPAQDGAKAVPASDKVTGNSQTAPNKTDAQTAPRAASGDNAVKKEYRKLPYWADFVQKCTERDGMLGSFMRESAKGFTVNTDELVHIRTNNRMALTIITNMFQTLLEVLNAFEGGRLDKNLVKLEYVPEKKEDADRSLDELIRNSGENNT